MDRDHLVLSKSFMLICASSPDIDLLSKIFNCHELLQIYYLVAIPKFFIGFQIVRMLLEKLYVERCFVIVTRTSVPNVTMSIPTN